MLRRRLSMVRDERGMTLIELVVATTAGMVVFLGLTMTVVSAMHSSTRISNRVTATADARLASQRITKELQSACAARYLTPVRKGSNGTKLKFARAYGSAVSPSPVMSEVKLEGTNLVVWEYPVSGGSTPEWEFDETTPTLKRALINNVSVVSASVPVFRYYSLSNGVITGPIVGTDGGNLTEAQADTVVKVDIAIRANPPGTPVADAGGSAIVQNSAYLRFSPPTYVTTSPNKPCE